MPVKIDPELAALRQAAKAPREGFFSVLDELIGQLPEGRALSVDELRQRLKPGRTLERGGIKFPLKQAELDYALPELSQWSPELRIESRDRLRDFVRKRRPEFVARDPIDDPTHTDYSQYSTKGPERFDYFESVTDSPDFGEHSTHFTDNTLSFSRGTRHELPGGWVDRNGQNHSGGVLRLIDEIQNDRANDARRKIKDSVGDEILAKHFLSPEELDDYWRIYGTARNRRTPQMIDRLKELDDKLDAAGSARIGWRTPEQQARYNELMELRGQRKPPFNYVRTYGDDTQELPPEENELSVLAATVPDAPFKTPQEYGRFEIKKQILDALDADDEYLGITPASGPASWFPGTGAKDTTYDKIYPGELRKIAQQYGAPFENVDVPVTVYEPLGLPSLEGTDIEDFTRRHEWRHERHVINDYRSAVNDLINAGHISADEIEWFNKMDTEIRALIDADDADSVDPAIADKLFVAVQEYADKLRAAYTRAANETAGAGVRAVRSVPSMRLTPEVKDRISKIGLPLFTVAGASLLAPGQEGEEEMPAYAGGGVVRKSAGMLKRIRDAEEKASRGRANEAAWAGDFGAAGGRKTPEAEGYGDWAAKSAGKAPREASDGPKKGRKGALSTIRDYLGLYEGGSARLADMYPDAFEGEYEDGDEFLGEDEEWEYYACGGPVKRGIGGKIKKAVKKVAKVGKALAPVIGKIPGVGTVAGGLIGGVSGLIADGNLKGALSGALSGASGGVSNALLSNAMGLGSALLDANNAKAKAKKTAAAQAPAAGGVPPERIAQVPDLVQLQQQAQQTQAAMPSQLSMVQPQGQRVQPGSNAGGLLQRIQQQQAALG